MIKKLLFLFVFLFCSITAYAAEMVNVEYIHQLVSRDWDIEIPYNPALTNPKVAANMKYLLVMVDKANEILNGKKTTNYGDSEYATMAAADTIATNDAVRRLITIEQKFFVTTTPNTNSFSFSISAAGTYFIDWGDGTHKMVVRDNTNSEPFSHTYSVAKAYKIGIGGLASDYNKSDSIAAISFANNTNIAAIDGSLGTIFSTLGNDNGQQPRFYRTFYGCNKLTDIPDNLFYGINDIAASKMFRETFANCTTLAAIPKNLFAGLTGGRDSTFYSTFQGCSNLTTIPAELFANLSGPAGNTMFGHTFQDCKNLQTVPPGLFDTISGQMKYGLFASTFYGCTKLSNLPDKLFAGFTGTDTDMFNSTFRGCKGLTEIPAKLFGDLSGTAATRMFYQTFYGCSNITTVPAGLFDGISGPAAPQMFTNTFSYTGLKTLPDKLFSDISGAVANDMFYGTFENCKNLTAIPKNLFGDLTGDFATGMFSHTFNNCTSLTGDSAKINNQYLYNIWPDLTAEQIDDCYNGATGLTDYDDIPKVWK